MPDAPPQHHRSWLKRAWYRFTQFVIGVIARIYFRVSTHGRDNAPMSGPVVFVCNHASHLDPLLVGVFCPRIICYFARVSLFTGPLGPLIRSYDAIPVDNQTSPLAGVRATLARVKQGDAVLVFPEGARTQDGAMQKLQPGFITLIRRGKASLAPVGLSGAYEAMPRGVLFPRPKKIAVVYGEAIPHERLAEMTDENLLELVTQEITACVTRADKVAGRGDGGHQAANGE
jgi:1-acyl-sn-glycerol-3-phosphate acyltransferase